MCDRNWNLFLYGQIWKAEYPDRDRLTSVAPVATTEGPEIHFELFRRARRENFSSHGNLLGSSDLVYTLEKIHEAMIEWRRLRQGNLHGMRMMIGTIQPFRH